MTRRGILAAIAVAIWCMLVAWLIRWRSAPPPPPDIHIPGGAMSSGPG